MPYLLLGAPLCATNVVRNRSSLLVMLFATLFLLSPASYAKDWNTAEIVSKDTNLYGALEARLKPSKGSGAITHLIWITPATATSVTGANPQWQELAFEFFGKSPDGKDYQTQIITPSNVPEEDPAGDFRKQHLVMERSPVNFFDEFVTARIEWEPKRIAFYMNGDLVREQTAEKDYEEYKKFWDNSDPMEIRIGLWAGFSDWSGQVDPSNPPTQATIDYVSYTPYENGKLAGTPEWKDDFNSLDTGRWTQSTHTFSYAVTEYTPSNAKIEDGDLVLDFTHS